MLFSFYLLLRHLRRYIDAATLEPYGFLPAAKFRNKSFQQAALEIAQEADAAVMAAQIDGSLVINPSTFVLTDRTILFALAGDQDKLHGVAFEGNAEVSNWLPTFGMNRKEGGAEGKYAAAQAALGYDQNYTAAGRESTTGDDHNGGLDPEPKSSGRLLKPGMGVRPGASKVRVTSMNNVGAKYSSTALPSTHPDIIVAKNDAQSDQNGKPPTELLSSGGHVVLALISQVSDTEAFQGLWQQVEVIVKNLRESADTPLVVISGHGLGPHSPVKAVAQRIRKTYSTSNGNSIFVVEGDPLKPHVLTQAGVRRGRV